MTSHDKKLSKLPLAGNKRDDQDQWWRGAVIYQIYPRSFQDTNGDGVGDLQGIADRLDHVAGLGVDAIWLSPFFTSPMKDMGYDVSDYCDVDPVFGTIEDFDTLVSRAHTLGLKVIIDQVLSHSSDQHPWFRESQLGEDSDKADWYVWTDPLPDGTPPTNWLSVFGGSAWSWNTKRRQYYLHNFLPSQPDLNFHNPAVQDALLETVRFWLERGVDGFRLDTVNFYFHDKKLRNNPPVSPGSGNDVPDLNPYGYQDHLYDKTRPENIDFLKRFRALLETYPGTTSVGEVGDGERSLKTMADYTSGGDKLHTSYSFDMLGPKFSREHFETCIQDFDAASGANSGGFSWPCWAFSNHDVVRHMTRWADLAEDQTQLAKLAGSLLLSLRGSVCFYQGEELGLTEAELRFEDITDPYGLNFWPEFKGRDGCRTPMVWNSTAKHAGFSNAKKTWLPVAAEHLEKSADQQIGVDTSIYEHYRRFITFRKNRRELVSGDIEFLDWHPDGLAFVRRSEERSTLCVFNLSGNSTVFACPADNSITPISGHGFSADFDGSEIRLGGHQAFFGELA